MVKKKRIWEVQEDNFACATSHFTINYYYYCYYFVPASPLYCSGCLEHVVPDTSSKAPVTGSLTQHKPFPCPCQLGSARPILGRK